MTIRNPFDAKSQAVVEDERRIREEIEFKSAKRRLDDVLSTPEGREAVCLLIEITKCQSSSFSTNALTMAFNEGRRAVGTQIINLCGAQTYLQLLKEQNERRNAKRRS